MRTLSFVVVVLALVLAEPRAAACPFCTALGPTLCQLREQASVVALAEVEHTVQGGMTRVRLHKAIEGAQLLNGHDSLQVMLDVTAKPGGLLLLFGDTQPSTPPAEWNWHAVPVNETSYAYLVRAPLSKTPLPERLRYFAPFLEHPDATIAKDAYLEFGHAPLDQIAKVADALSMPKLRGWLVDPRVPPERKGFYGLALGLASDADQQAANAEFLKQLIVAPDDDFRAGFDGILGGYLLLAEQSGLDLIDQRYLNNPTAADGDVRHALTAMRFYHEYGQVITPSCLRAALRHLLARPEFTANVITDLARWQDWDAKEMIAALYTNPRYRQEETRRAIVGYLLTCPEPSAVELLSGLRKRDPLGVASAEQAFLAKTGVLPSRE
jgi:hypothetical protein